MNFVFLSPHFPTNFIHFSVALARLGVKVLGIADVPAAALPRPLQQALTDYVQVHDMHDYNSLVRACGYFTHRHGKIDRLDSLNEYWLETEAKLRTDFNIAGIRTDKITQIKRKSSMKEVFAAHQIPYGQGQTVANLAEAQAFIAQVGYPVVIKPDIGVGAANTWKIENQQELLQLFTHSPGHYLVEEFLSGTIYTYDGLTDQDGNIVYASSMVYSNGVMEVVNSDDHIYYYNLREIPADLAALGQRMVKAFDVRERFFHFEFFRSPSGELTALEVNMRPPGGLTTDMWNYAHNFDIYQEWANIIARNRFRAPVKAHYFCCYASRKAHIPYTHSHGEIAQALGPHLVHHQKISPIFSRAMGQHGYIFRAEELDDVISMAAFIQQTSVPQPSRERMLSQRV